jgi:hypothetical protein
MTGQFTKLLHSGTIDPAALTNADHRAMLNLIQQSINRPAKTTREIA